MVEIDLSNRPDVSGYIYERLFQKLKSLEVLNLENTRTLGLIGALRHNMELRYLNLNNTWVGGFYVGNFTKLRYLNLANTQVYLNIAALKNFTELRYLNLGYCMEVSGNLEALRTATRLKELNLRNALVGGDLRECHRVDTPQPRQHPSVWGHDRIQIIGGPRHFKNCDWV